MYEIIFRNYKTCEELITFGRDITNARIEHELGADWAVEYCDYID